MDDITRQIQEFMNSGKEITQLPPQKAPKRRYLAKEKADIVQALSSVTCKPMVFKDHFYTKGAEWLLEQRGMFYRSGEVSHLGYGSQDLNRTPGADSGCILSYEAITALDEVVKHMKKNKYCVTAMKALELYFVGYKPKGQHRYRQLHQAQVAEHMNIKQQKVSSLVSDGLALVTGYLVCHFEGAQ